jgi:23S rRNA (cytidine1920-2'-O)/16S rRNA (cytidine1409-2'-O)-methyltransferase
MDSLSVWSSRSLRLAKARWAKKGVVRDPAVHLEVLEQFLTHAAASNLTVKGITFSPIRGPEGNIEYLGWLTAAQEEPQIPDLAALVQESHRTLEK